MHYLLFGASTTHGESDYECGGWQNHLRKLLDTKEKGRHFYNLAIPGDTSADLLKRIKSETLVRLRNKPKKEWTIMVSIGINDSRLENGEPNVSLDQYQKNVSRILEITETLAHQTIWIGSQPVIEHTCNPFKKHLFFYNERIKDYSHAAEVICNTKNVPFINLFSELENRPDLEKLSDDGLHPNKHGHLVMFEIIKQFLEKEEFSDENRKKSL